MIEAWRFMPGKPDPEELPLDTVVQAITHAGDDMIWIDVEHPSVDDIDRLTDLLRLDEFLVEDLREGTDAAGQRTKLLRYGDVFHVAARDCSPVGREIVGREVDLVFGAGWLCSVRHPPDGWTGDDPDPFPVGEVRRRTAIECANKAALDEGTLVWSFLDVITDRYFVITNAVDEHIDSAEERLLEDERSRHGGRPNIKPEALYDLGRLLTHFRHEVVPLRDVVASLLRHEDPEIDDATLIRLRDVHDHLLGITEFIESQRDVLAGLRDVQLAIVSNAMNKSMQQLAAWGAILIVATLITGVFGMNFDNAPDLHWRDGFLIVVALMAVIGIPMYLFFKRQEWL